MRKFVLISVMLMIGTRSYSQIDETFQKLLSTSFQDERVSKYIFTSKSIKGNAAYIRLNKEFEFYAADFGRKVINSPNLNTQGMSHIFDAKDVKIFVFDRAIMFNDDYSRLKIDTAILFNKITFNRESAMLLFHTTSLSSKKWYKQSRSTQKFVKIKCELMFNGRDWMVQQVKIFDSNQLQI